MTARLTTHVSCTCTSEKRNLNPTNRRKGRGLSKSCVFSVWDSKRDVSRQFVHKLPTGWVAHHSESYRHVKKNKSDIPVAFMTEGRNITGSTFTTSWIMWRLDLEIIRALEEHCCSFIFLPWQIIYSRNTGLEEQKWEYFTFSCNKD